MADPLPPLPRAVLFDLGDTLVTYGHASRDAWDILCREYAHACGVDADGLRDVIDRHSREFWSDPDRHRRERVDMLGARRKVLALVLDELGVHVDDAPALVERMARRRQDLHMELLELFPDARETVERLHRAGVRLGMVTNGTAVDQWTKIDRFGLRDFFHAFVVEGEFGRGKPDREVFKHVLDTLDVAPADAWMVGDNLAMDIAPARDMGLHTIWHDWRGTGLPADAPCEPHRIIRRFTDLLPADDG